MEIGKTTRMQASNPKPSGEPATDFFELDEGWALAPEPERSARPAVIEPEPAPAPHCPSTQEIDDGWVLPDEPRAASAVVAIEVEVDGVEAVRAVGTGKVEVDDADAVIAAVVDDDGLLDVNVATVEELCALPGIGRLRAKRIIAARERAGGFESVDDLKVVQGVGPKTLEQLRALLTVR